MFGLIEKIKGKPEGERRRVALMVTISLFIVIVFVWFTLIKFPLGGQSTENVTEAQNAPGPLSGLIANTSGAVASIKESVSRLFSK